MSKITKIYGRQVIDSRGNPTVEVEVFTEAGNMGRAIVPSGASTGIREALELRDGDKTQWGGKSVLKAVANVNDKIAPAVVGMDVTAQRDIDAKMIKLDGDANKANFGANAILGVSMAAAVAASKDKGIALHEYFNSLAKEGTPMSLPAPMLNVLNGGEHADNNVDMQEFMLFPLGAPTFAEALRWSSEVFHVLQGLLHRDGLATGKGDEGGFAPDLKSNEDALKYIMEAIEGAGYVPGKDFYIAMDPAASEFYNKETGMYELKGEGVTYTSEQMVDYWEKMVDTYPIVSIEDGMDETDWEGFKLMTERLGDRLQVVGDDLFVTNPKILAEGIEKGVANSILIKVNQIGTISETIDAIELAHANGYTAITSHRSGESEDSIIADLAVGLNTKQIKTGSMSRSDRIAKYNQLIRVNESVNTFHGKKSLNVEVK